MLEALCPSSFEYIGDKLAEN
uniref:Uncharacterized protein n=1 Tax=Arundo donax TaxID=35708 RepID=A0A0A9TXR7_ARUDO